MSVVNPMDPEAPSILNGDQLRRLMTLRAAVDLFSGRGVAWWNIVQVAEWIYSGTEPKL